MTRAKREELLMNLRHWASRKSDLDRDRDLMFDAAKEIEALLKANARLVAQVEWLKNPTK